MFYVRHRYMTGPELDDHIGPFATRDEASNHLAEFGPQGATVVALDDAPELVMTPDQHVTYMVNRV